MFGSLLRCCRKKTWPVIVVGLLTVLPDYKQAMCARLLSFSQRVYARISVKGRIREGHRHLIHVRVFMSVIRVNVNDAGFKG